MSVLLNPPQVDARNVSNGCARKFGLNWSKLWQFHGDVIIDILRAALGKCGLLERVQEWVHWLAHLEHAPCARRADIFELLQQFTPYETKVSTPKDEEELNALSRRGELNPNDPEVCVAMGRLLSVVDRAHRASSGRNGQLRELEGVNRKLLCLAMTGVWADCTDAELANAFSDLDEVRSHWIGFSDTLSATTPVEYR